MSANVCLTVGTNRPHKKGPIWSWRCLTDVNYKGRRAHDTTDVLTTYTRSVHDDKRLSSSGHNF